MISAHTEGDLDLNQRVILGRQRSSGGSPDSVPEGGGGSVGGGADPAGGPPRPQPQQPPQPDASDSRRQEEPWFEALLEFAQDALGALQGDRLRVLIAEKPER